MVLIIILLVSGKTADFDVALEECMQLFVEQRDLLHRRHEVVKAFDEFRWFSRRTSPAGLPLSTT